MLNFIVGMIVGAFVMFAVINPGAAKEVTANAIDSLNKSIEAATNNAAISKRSELPVISKPEVPNK